MSKILFKIRNLKRLSNVRILHILRNRNVKLKIEFSFQTPLRK